MTHRAVCVGLPRAQAPDCPSALGAGHANPFHLPPSPGHYSHPTPLAAQGHGAASGWAPPPLTLPWAIPPAPQGLRGQALREQGEPQTPSEHTKGRGQKKK